MNGNYFFSNHCFLTRYLFDLKGKEIIFGDYILANISDKNLKDELNKNISEIYKKSEQDMCLENYIKLIDISENSSKEYVIDIFSKIIVIKKKNARIDIRKDKIPNILWILDGLTGNKQNFEFTSRCFFNILEIQQHPYDFIQFIRSTIAHSYAGNFENITSFLPQVNNLLKFENEKKKIDLLSHYLEVLTQSSLSYNSNFSLLNSISALELFLNRKEDSRRPSKQLTYKLNKILDNFETDKLKTIYGYRNSITHGNFQTIPDNLVSETNYIINILKQIVIIYIKNPNFNNKFMPYDHTQSEQSVNQFWKDNNTFATPKINIGDKKKYILDAFAYPSGKGIHAGHAEGYIATDILARYYRQTGYKVLFPVGFDSFGLPAENYAIKTGVHPRINTDETIKYYREQISAIGLSNDWADEFGTHNADYYKWTQWFFSLLYERGLAYKKEALVNWDPVDQTVLANEQVLADGTAERSGAMVEQKMMSQWFFKITDYADRLLTDLDKINWPSSTKLMQKNWIGKSVGAEVDFEVEPHPNPLLGEKEQKLNYLFLHGWEGSSETNFLPEIKAQFEAKGLSIQIPDLPNSSNPNIDQQANYVLANCHIDTNTVIVGHSLGVAVGLKVLQKLDFKITKFISVAGFVSNEFRQDNLPQGVTDPFDISQVNFDFDKIKSKCQGFKGIWSDDDQFITEQQTQTLETALGFETVKIIGGKHLSNLNQKSVLNLIFEKITVFTTRIDTIYSGTFLILAPEHPMVTKLTTPTQLEQVTKYQTLTKTKSQFERTEMNKDKSGVWTGSYAINPANSKKIQIWISDFVLASYGSGAVFADAHDERDFEMAKKFGIPLMTSIKPTPAQISAKLITSPQPSPISEGDYEYSYEDRIKNLEECFSGYGILYNSGQFDGLESKEAMSKIIEFGESQGWAKAKVTYRLRDWLVSRQRYWGSPIPIVYVPTSPQPSPTDEGVKTQLENIIPKYITDLARKLRQESTPTETMMWKILRNRNFLNLKFTRQQPFGRYIADFYCHELKLVIELDGKIHESQKDYDNNRDKELSSASLTVLRFTNDQIQNNIDQVLQTIADFKQNFKLTLTTPSPVGEGWGEVDKIAHKETLVPHCDLPVILPDDVEFKPTGRSPLIDHSGFHASAESLYGAGTVREADTMDTFACSSWYMFRFMDPHNNDVFASPDSLKSWGPIDEYVIGAEHCVLHLLYARFFTKVLFDSGYIDFDEPFTKVTHPGIILGSDNRKMSKRWGNVINPMDVVEEFGADALRLYVMFMGPFEQSKPWSTSSLKGTRRFLDRVWNLQDKIIATSPQPSPTGERAKNNSKVEIALHKLIKKIGEDIVNYSFNTAVAEFMKFVNIVDDGDGLTQEQFLTYLQVLAPFAPYITETLWQEQVDGGTSEGVKISIHTLPFPTFDENKIVTDQLIIGVQVNGKVRGSVEINKDLPMDQAQELAMNLDFVQKWIENKTLVKFIYVPAKIINIVVK